MKVDVISYGFGGLTNGDDFWKEIWKYKGDDFLLTSPKDSDDADDGALGIGFHGHD